MRRGKAAVAHYIEELSREMARVARKEQLEFLACFLEMAAAQAAEDRMTAVKGR